MSNRITHRHTTIHPAGTVLAVPDELVSLDAWRRAHAGGIRQWENDRENWRIDHGFNQVGFQDLLRRQHTSDRRAA